MLTCTNQIFYPMAKGGFISGHKAGDEANQLPSSGQEAEDEENSTSMTTYPFTA
jgi:hypothetical protein